MGTYMAREEHCPSSLAVSETISSRGAASLHAEGGGSKAGFSVRSVSRGCGHTRSDVGVDRPSVLFPLYAYATRVLPIGRVHLVNFVECA